MQAASVNCQARKEENWEPRTCFEASTCHLDKLQYHQCEESLEQGPLWQTALQAVQYLPVAVKGCLKGLKANWNTLLYLDASCTYSISSFFAKRCLGETLNNSLAEN